MKYYLVAGERSGDMHGGNLIKALSSEDGAAEFRCFGGDEMEAAGAEVVLHYNKLAMMGFVEVLLQYRKIKKYMKFCQEDVLSYRPDVLILIDYGGFNIRMAKYAKKHNIKVFYYITPKVWAWNQGRAKKIKQNVDRMFVILPFEKEFYKKYGWEVDYVGNPVVDAIKAYEPDADFRSKNALPPSKELIALLPGSRKQELGHILPTMHTVAQAMPEQHFVVAAVPNLPEESYTEISRLSNVSLVVDDAYGVLSQAKAAVVCSGTATLETALLNVPQVVAYKTSASTYYFVKTVIKVPYISLVNLIADKEVVKELIQGDMTADKITGQLKGLLNGREREEILEDYTTLRDVLGDTKASVNAAKKMYFYLS